MKRAIEQLSGVPAAQQKLICNKKQCSDMQTLAQLGVRVRSVRGLSLALRCTHLTAVHSSCYAVLLALRCIFRIALHSHDVYL